MSYRCRHARDGAALNVSLGAGFDPQASPKNGRLPLFEPGEKHEPATASLRVLQDCRWSQGWAVLTIAGREGYKLWSIHWKHLVLGTKQPIGGMFKKVLHQVRHFYLPLCG